LKYKTFFLDDLTIQLWVGLKNKPFLGRNIVECLGLFLLTLAIIFSFSFLVEDLFRFSVADQ